MEAPSELRKSDEKARMHECEVKDRSSEIWKRREVVGGGLFIVGRDREGEA